MLQTSKQPRVSLEKELSTLCAELIDAFMVTENQDAREIETSELELRELLKSYIKHVTRCGLCAGRKGLHELHDNFVQFQEILRNLSAQPVEVIQDYHSVLEQWPLLVMSYVNNPQNTEFLQQIQNLVIDTNWPDTLHEDQTSVEQLTSLISGVVVDSGSKPVINNTLLDEFIECFSDLDKLRLHDTKDNIDSIKSILSETAARFELFGISAASSELLGLMDVIQILQSSLHKHISTSEVITDNDWQAIYAVKQAVEAYLRSPNDVICIDRLINSVRQLPFTETLADSEIETMRSLFFIDSEEQSGSSDQADRADIQIRQENPVPLMPGKSECEDEELDLVAESVTPEVSKELAELLTLISSEFENVISILGENLQIFCAEESSSDERLEATRQYTSILQKFQSVSQSIELEGLSILFERLIHFFKERDPTVPLAYEQQMWLLEWPAYVQNYLSNPYLNAFELFHHCQSESTVLDLDGIDMQNFENLLASPNITIEEENEPRLSKAGPEDVSLDLPQDVNQQLLDSLLQELPHHTEEFSDAISSIIGGEGNLQDVEVAQRVAHTLKGSANTVGVTGIATLTHNIEDILSAFTKQQRLPQAPLTTALQDAADVLEMMSESLLGMGAVPEQQSIQVLQQILDWANLIEQSGLPETGQDIEPDETSEDSDDTPKAHHINEQTTLRVTTQSIDEILRLVGEGIITTGQLHESLRHVVLQNQLIQEQSTLFQQLAFELEQLIDIRGINKYLASSDHSKFDALEMDQYNELHTLTRRLVEAATDAREMTQVADDDLKHLETLMHSQSRIEKDTQELVMKTRMLPVQNIVPRLQRSVRQVCRQTGKNVDLEITGSETMIDSDILALLADPLMHLLRNAVDHGIEENKQRENLGKNLKGFIRLDFTREGEYIRIHCKDDGAGLDQDIIRAMAIKKGLITPETNLSDTELNRLILVAGFTTRDQTTQVSGRGIGMDIVYNQILKLKGTLRIDSTPGKGLGIEIQLPVSLITMHGIMVKVRDQDLALSNRGVEQILHNNAGTLINEDNQLYYEYDEEKYKAYYLEDLLGMMRKEQDINSIDSSALLVNSEDGNKYVVLVGKVTSTQDIVIKKLGRYVPAISGIEGATILGGGSIAPVIDLAGLLSAFQGRTYVPIIENSEITGIQSGTPKVLVVDDSLSARRSLAEFISDTGYRVVTARDGMEAVEKIELESPDILLVDMEMPRMNGLELTSYVRANPATQNLPVVMITSRATEKHRDEADRAGVNAYLVKPYSENEVIDVVEAQLTRAFDINITAVN